jgi:2-hydroxychromene-2-carboxylate isomerase
MTHIDFWYDPVSPYAWLAFEALPQALAGCHYAVRYQPVLFAGLLKAHGHKGPAEIPPKRVWTYKQVQWLAQRQGTRLDLPTPHPYNPLALLRLALACAPAGGHPNRRVVEATLQHAWCAGGADPNDPARLAALRSLLQPGRDPDGDEVKAELRARTDAAIGLGLFGVPTMVVGGEACEAFWGLDALPMLRERIAAP